jgi:phytol kinase
MTAVLNVSGGLKTVMGQEDKKRNWGLVQYPVSIIILIVLKMLGVGDSVALGCAILGMGYGDGLASIFGRALKSRKISEKNPKTLAGCITMFVVTFIVIVLMKRFIGNVTAASGLIPVALLGALAATLVEAFTPFGLDNISVPVVIYLIAGLL